MQILLNFEVITFQASDDYKVGFVFSTIFVRLMNAFDMQQGILYFSLVVINIYQKVLCLDTNFWVARKKHKNISIN